MRGSVWVVVSALLLVGPFLFHTLPTVDIVSVESAWSVTLSELEQAPSGHLFEATRVRRQGEGQLIGPESFVPDPDQPGTYFAGTADGHIVRIQGDQVSPFAFTGGRPLGLVVLSRSTHPKFPENWKLVVAEALHGLVAIDRNGGVHVLANHVEGTPIRYANDLDVDEEGRIYFTDSSAIPPVYDKRTGWWSTMKAALFDILSGYPSGRLLCYDPHQGTTRVLLRSLAYANGVAVDQSGAFVLVAETGRYAVRQYWLHGERAGTWNYLLEGLPVLPDGVSHASDGTFWLSGFRRTPVLDWAHRVPWLKRLCMQYFLEALFQFNRPYGFVMQFDAQGALLRTFHDPSGTLLPDISSVHYHQEQGSAWLLLGGLTREFIALYPLDSSH